MLKLVMCVKRLPNISRKDFVTYWKNKHAPLVDRYKDILGIRHYVQTVMLDNPAAQHALQQGRGTLPVNFDGCAELWWDDMESHLNARASEEGKQALAALIADESQFVDLQHSQLWYGEEHRIL